MMLKRTQLLGRNTIYNSRYKKKLWILDRLQRFARGVVVDLVRHPLTGKPVMVLDTDLGKLRLPAIKGVSTGDVLDAQHVGLLSQMSEGSTVCCVTHRHLPKVALVAAGCKGIYMGRVGAGYVVRVGRRMVTFPDSLCLRGSIAGADIYLKPRVKAGTAYKIHKARGKKYPWVSAHKMNVHQSQTGGSHRKKRGAPTSISRRAAPGSKCGNLAPRRTGRR